MSKAKEAGDLDVFNAFDAEMRRFQAERRVETPTPETDALARAQVIYLRRREEIQRRYHRALVRQSGTLLEWVDAREKQLVREDRIEKALALRAWKTELEASDELAASQTWLKEHPPPPADEPGLPATAKKTYLSDLPIQKHQVGYGKLGLGNKLGYGDRNVKVEGRNPQHVISMHPFNNGRPAFVEIDLPKPFTWLLGAVTLNATARKRFRHVARFRVLGDGELLWESGDFRRKDPTLDFKIPVRGVKKLRLEILAPEKYNSAHTLFLDPYVW